MGLLVEIVQWEVFLFLGGLAAIMAHKMVTGRINTTNLLADKETGELSSSRVQLLVLTVLGVISYLVLVADHAAANAGSLPEIPDSLVAVVGGSNAVYLVAKGLGRSSLTAPFTDNRS